MQCTATSSRSIRDLREFSLLYLPAVSLAKPPTADPVAIPHGWISCHITFGPRLHCQDVILKGTGRTRSLMQAEGSIGEAREGG